MEYSWDIKQGRAICTKSNEWKCQSWLKQKDHWLLEELSTHLSQHYDVEFKSRQSYYDLFTQAGLSWNSTQKRNPKNDAEAVAAQKKSPFQCLQQHQEDVEQGLVRVLMLDECQMLVGRRVRLRLGGSFRGEASSRNVPWQNQRAH